jgi:hypothetical protein
MADQRALVVAAFSVAVVAAVGIGSWWASSPSAPRSSSSSLSVAASKAARRGRRPVRDHDSEESQEEEEEEEEAVKEPVRVRSLPQRVSPRKPPPTVALASTTPEPAPRSTTGAVCTSAHHPHSPAGGRG